MPYRCRPEIIESAYIFITTRCRLARMALTAIRMGRTMFEDLSNLRTDEGYAALRVSYQRSLTQCRLPFRRDLQYSICCSLRQDLVSTVIFTPRPNKFTPAKLAGHEDLRLAGFHRENIRNRLIVSPTSTKGSDWIYVLRSAARLP